MLVLQTYCAYSKCVITHCETATVIYIHLAAEAQFHQNVLACPVIDQSVCDRTPDILKL